MVWYSGPAMPHGRSVHVAPVGALAQAFGGVGWDDGGFGWGEGLAGRVAGVVWCAMWAL